MNIYLPSKCTHYQQLLGRFELDAADITRKHRLPALEESRSERIPFPVLPRSFRASRAYREGAAFRR